MRHRARLPIVTSSTDLLAYDCVGTLRTALIYLCGKQGYKDHYEENPKECEFIAAIVVCVLLRLLLLVFSVVAAIFPRYNTSLPIVVMLSFSLCHKLTLPV
jgi:hypothetical protein